MYATMRVIAEYDGSGGGITLVGAFMLGIKSLVLMQNAKFLRDSRSESYQFMVQQ